VKVGATVKLLIVPVGEQAAKVLAIDPASCWIHVEMDRTRHWINPFQLLSIRED
jgi:hypothetical protein